MFAGRGAARLLLVAVFAVAVADFVRRPRSKPTRTYRPNKNALMLLKHVMMHEKQWALVLQEPIKLHENENPPHAEREFRAPSVSLLLSETENPDHVMFNIHEIVTVVYRHYSLIRSFVEYAAKIVIRALSCFTFKMLTFQFHCIRLMIEKNGDPRDVMATIYNLRNNTAAYIDVLAAVPDADLSTTLNIYWETVRVLQNGSMERLDRQPWPEWMMKIIMETTDNINNYLIGKCRVHEVNEDFYLNTGVRNLPPLFKDISFDTLLDVEKLVDMTREQARFMAQHARDLGIINLPDHAWTSMFFSRGLPRFDESLPIKVTESGTSETGSSSENSEGEPSQSVSV